MYTITNQQEKAIIKFVCQYLREHRMKDWLKDIKETGWVNTTESFLDPHEETPYGYETAYIWVYGAARRVGISIDFPILFPKKRLIFHLEHLELETLQITFKTEIEGDWKYAHLSE